MKIDHKITWDNELVINGIRDSIQKYPKFASPKMIEKLPAPDFFGLNPDIGNDNT